LLPSEFGGECLLKLGDSLLRYFDFTFSMMLVAVFSISPSYLVAQNKVGTALVGGEKVELFADQTWKFAASASKGDANCSVVAAGLTFCGKTRGWDSINNSSAEISGQFMLDSRNFGLLIVENIGAVDGVTPKMMRSIVVENFAAGTGGPAGDVVIFSVDNSELDGRAAETVVYGGSLNGLDVVFRNSIVLEDRRVLQVATYAIEAQPTENSEKLHNEFVSLNHWD
jgi:hypothetical protein